MLALNHTLFGIMIAVTVKKPELVVPLAFSSHFVLDVVPHFGNSESFGTYSKKFFRVIQLDTISATTASLIAIYFWPQMIWMITLGVWSSIAPDLLWPFAKNTKKGSLAWKFFRFHKKIQLSETRNGIISEIAWFSLFTGALASIYLAAK
jgi:hypothetical protein